MNDRYVFRNNLNRFLSESGKKQKDLAEYVGAKTTTVSGWTRGISYPRADAMEKIAMFFGITTSQLIEDDETVTIHDLVNNAVRAGILAGQKMVAPQTEEAKIISAGIDKMEPERREQALKVLQTIFADIFDGGKNDGP